MRGLRVTRAGLAPGIACSQYAGWAAALVHGFKVSGSAVLAAAMAEALAGAALAERAEWFAGPVVLVPAPSSRGATRLRGYVPARLLAREVARALRSRGVVVRVVSAVRLAGAVRDQSVLGRLEREQNLHGKMFVPPHLALRLASARACGARIALFDDVVTTGATLREMSRALTAAGLSEDFFVTFSETF